LEHIQFSNVRSLTFKNSAASLTFSLTFSSLALLVCRRAGVLSVFGEKCLVKNCKIHTELGKQDQTELFITHKAKRFLHRGRFLGNEFAPILGP
jgi:hypothetical protein